VLIVTVLFLFYDSAYSYDLGFLEIHGFASPGYMISSDNNYIVQSEDGSFQFNEFGFQLLSRDMGTIGNNEVTLDWGLIDYQWRDELGFKFGRIKLPHGLYNDTRDYDMLRTAILLPQGVYREDYRGDTQSGYDGCGFYGKLLLGRGGLLGYNFYLGKGSINSNGGVAKAVTRDNMKFKSANVDYIAGGQFKWHTQLTGLLFSATFYQINITYKSESILAPVDIQIDTPALKVSIFPGEYSIGNFTAAAEYQMIKG